MIWPATEQSGTLQVRAESESCTLQSVGINHVNDARDLRDEADGADVALCVGEAGWQAEEILAAHGRDLHREGILKVIGVVHVVLRDELLGTPVLDGHDVLEEVDELECVAAMTEEEVDAISHLLDVDGLLCRLVLQNQLLEQVESALVVDLGEA